MSFKLLVEKPDLSDFEYIVEEKNAKEPSKLYIQGPFMMASEKNRNNRIYNLEEMAKEVDRYTEEMINENRAMGELNHPTTAEVDLERACHIITELKQKDNVFYGKSKVLSTPCGQIVKSLIMDGVKVGVSSRALGKLDEAPGGVSVVQDMKLVAIDCVADPSFPKAFVNGILESKQWVLANDGKYEEIYSKFENSIKNLPKKDFDSYLKEQIISFIKNF
tara:strand:+ start:2305 stop:2964 length:660 start_codon:yes stop_codon:yes gene_type:complete